MTGETTFQAARGHGLPGTAMVGYRADGVPEGTHVLQPSRQEGIQLSVDPLLTRALFGRPAERARWAPRWSRSCRTPTTGPGSS